MLRPAYALLVTLVLSTSALAQPVPAVPTRYQVSTDVPADIAGTVVLDADIAELVKAGSIWSELHDLSAVLPAGVGVDAIHCFANGDVVFSTDTAFSWTGGEAADEDLVLFSAGALSLIFDGSGAGLPETVDLDAAAVCSLSPFDILLSIDSDAILGAVTVTDDDIVAYSAGGVFSVFLAGSSWLGPEQDRADVDGLAIIRSTGKTYISLDVSVDLGVGMPATDDELILLSGGAASSVTTLTAFPSGSTDVDGLDVQLRPELDNLVVSSSIVNTETPVTWTIEYLDHDNDAPAAGSPALSIDGGSPLTMTQTTGCGTPLCDGDFTNGESFEVAATVGYGASHSGSVTAIDGIDAAPSEPGAGPSYVSTPGDADGDTDVDAADLAVILIENFDSNGGSGLDLVRGGLLTTSWGGADADSDQQIGTNDLVAALAVIFDLR